MNKKFIFIITIIFIAAGLMTNCSQQELLSPDSPDLSENSGQSGNMNGFLSGEPYGCHNQNPSTGGNTTIKTQVITITKDAELRERYANDNFGSYSGIKISAISGQRAHMIMDFDLSDIPSSAKIIEAKLTLININRSDVNVILYPLLTSWEEMQVTWNSPWTTPGGDINTAVSTNAVLAGRSVPTVINISKLIQSLVNTPGNGGIEIQSIGGNMEAQVASREYSGNQQSLAVVYSVATASPAQQIKSALNQILLLNRSDFYHHNAWMAKLRFKKLCNSAIFFINRHKNKQAKTMINSIISLMDGKGHNDLIINAAARDRIRPLFEQIKAEL